MGEITRVGVDLAKRVIQVHAVDATGRVIVAKQLQRDGFTAWCAQLPPGCLVAMEACSGSHYWGRRLQAMGLQVKLIAPHFVSPYRLSGKTGKNDAADAAAELGAIARMALQRAHLHWIEIECHIAWCDERIAMHVRSDEQAKAASKVCGIGPVTASALVATIDDFKQFKNGRQFSAWMGLAAR